MTERHAVTNTERKVGADAILALTTPGPWHADGFIVRDGGGALIADACGDSRQPPEVSHSNADLIADAPDMRNLIRFLKAENDELKIDVTTLRDITEQLKDHANEDRAAHQAKIAEMQGCCSCTAHSPFQGHLGLVYGKKR